MKEMRHNTNGFNFPRRMFFKVKNVLKKIIRRLRNVLSSERRKIVKDKQYLLTQMRIMAHVTHKDLSIPSLQGKRIYFNFYLQLKDVLGELSKSTLDSETYEWAKQICSEYKRRNDYES